MAYLNFIKMITQMMLFSSLSILLFAGCSTTYVITEMDPSYKIKIYSKIKIHLPNTPTIEDKKFKFLLEKNLELKGFITTRPLTGRWDLANQIVALKAKKLKLGLSKEEKNRQKRLKTKLSDVYIPIDYSIFFVINDSSEQSNYTIPIMEPSRTYSSGKIGNTEYSNITESSKVTYYSGTKTISYKTIFLSVNKIKNKKFEEIWTGFIKTEYDEYHNKKNRIVQKIVSLIGKNFKGNIDIK